VIEYSGRYLILEEFISFRSGQTGSQIRNDLTR